MLWCQDLEQYGFCMRNNFLRVISVIRCPGRCDDTRSTCVEFLTILGQIAAFGVIRVL